MSNNIVSYELDPTNLAPLTDAQIAQIAVLHTMSDGDIDTGDIPPLTATFWNNAVRNPFYKPTKTLTRVRVDSDVLAWLKSKGAGYQTHLNLILREAMLKEISS